MNEWIAIPDYEGIYEITKEGVIRHTTNKRIRKPQQDRLGYLNIRLRKEGAYHTEMIHRLIARAFIPNPRNYPEINHKNEIKNDNRLENLEWCDRDYNTHYGHFGEK